MSSFQIDRRILAACAPAMSKEITRYYLCGVHVFTRDGKIIYEAINGHIAIRITPYERYDGDDFDIIIPSHFVDKVSKPKFMTDYGHKKNEFKVDAAISDREIVLKLEGGSISTLLIDGVFPPVDRVIPEGTSCRDLDFDSIRFDFSLFNKFEKSLKALRTKGAVLSFQRQGELAALMKARSALVECEWVGVIMPMRKG